MVINLFLFYTLTSTAKCLGLRKLSMLSYGGGSGGNGGCWGWDGGSGCCGGSVGCCSMLNWLIYRLKMFVLTHGHTDRRRRTLAFLELLSQQRKSARDKCMYLIINSGTATSD